MPDFNRSTLKNTLLAGFYSAASLITFNAYCAEPPKGLLVEGSYMVSFNDPANGEKPVIDPPSKLNYRPVPFGEHNTGQSGSARKNLGY